MSVSADKRTSLSDLASLFFRLGATAFGGPAAHISMMEDEVVRRRQWLTKETFLDYVGATHLIPGPNSTELAMHIGYARAGVAGLLVAGVCFIIPAVCIVTAIAWMYVRYGTLPEVTGVLYGIKPVVIAVVLQALWRLGHTAVKTRLLLTLGVVGVIAAASGIDELIILAMSGIAMAVMTRRRSSLTDTPSRLPLLTMIANTSHDIHRMTSWDTSLGSKPTVITTSAGVGILSGTVALNWWMLFGVFLKAGAVLFGSGYVLLAFLRADLIQRLHWLTEQQLLDAIAIGQVTPGPVFTTATFIGYLLGGGWGATVATIGIFLPAFVFVAVSGVYLPRVRNSPVARTILDGVNVASLALMMVVTWDLARSAIIDPLTIVLAVTSAVLLLRYRVNSVWLVLGGGLIGFITT